MKKSPKRTNRPRQPGQGAQTGLSSVAFATTAKSLSTESRQWGHEAPSFRSPPRVAGVRRSITRRDDGSSSVAVATRNRSAVAVMSDMVEGVIVATEVPEAERGAFRDALWLSVESHLADVLSPAHGKQEPTASRVSVLPRAS